MSSPGGHRERLRQKFRLHPDALTDAEHLELLLTYVIPRRDVSTLAKDLLGRFGDVESTICASEQELIQVEGIGESTITFFQLLCHFMMERPIDMTSKHQSQKPPQLNLFIFDEDTESDITSKAKSNKVTHSMGQLDEKQRVFVEDEVSNALSLLPKVSKFKSYGEFRQYLIESLPYNSSETRQRRASYILNRFYPNGVLDTPLSYYLTLCASQADLKPVIFYHILQAEPIASLVAEELIWPSLPMGMVNRAKMSELILLHRPDIKEATLAKILHSVFNTYTITDLGTSKGSSLYFQLKSGTLESFLYILTSEYPEPGMYSFENLYNGALHHWMLWDRDWIRRQLYNLQDYGVVAKISEIDTVRQFTLDVDQRSALQKYFMHPNRSQLAIRDDPSF